jgi:hypothetical protein
VTKATSHQLRRQKARSRGHYLRLVLLAVALAFLADAIVAGPTSIPSWAPHAMVAFAVCWIAAYVMVERPNL